MDPVEEEAILRAALELVFEDDLTPRREGSEGDVGGWSLREDDVKGERWVRVYLTRTGKFWDSNIVPPPS